MTGRDLITASLRLIGALAPGESLAAGEATDGLASLNRMLGTWSTEGLIIPAETREEFNLVAGTSSYTMGSGGAFNTSRPQEIIGASIKDTSVTPNLEIPMKLISFDEWQNIRVKENQSTYPEVLYDDGAYPKRALHVWPQPSVVHTIVIFSKSPLTAITTLDTSTSVPPGYEEAMIYNLAVRLSPEYGKTVPEPVAVIAMESRAGIKRSNIRPAYLKCDDALLPMGAGTFNIKTGGY